MMTDSHILIVNASAAAREQVRQTLERAGFTAITEADSGLAAIDILSKQNINILVTDIPLGQLDGWRLTRLVRSGVLKVAADLPVVILSTTYSERIAEVTAKEFEVNRFIPYEELETLPEAIQGIQQNETLPKSTLLVIEDYPDTRQLIKRMLHKRFSIETAADGESGIKAWKERRHDLVLLDMMLPNVSGETVLTEILKIDPRQAVVIMTAHSSAERAGALVLKGAVDFIPKPFRADQLRRVCEIALHREDFIVSNEQFSQHLAQLRENEEKYRHLIEALREDHFFYTFNKEGAFTYLSPSISNVLGYSEEEFIGHHAEYLTGNPINKDAVERRALSLAGTAQPAYEFEILHKDGSVHRLEVSESPVFDKQGAVISVDGIAHDITERMHMQRQLRQAQKMESIGQLTGGIAHDFNNILGSILGYTGLALEKFAKDGQGKLAEYLTEVSRAGERARDLIQQMLAFSRGGAAEPKPLVLTPLIAEGVKMLRSTVPSSIAIETDLAEDVPAVMMDTVQLHQLIMNLCINARDAIEDGKGRIDIRLHTVTGLQANCSSCHRPVSGDFVELVIEDDGEGMDLALLNKIFDPFFTTKEVGKGTGMGLSMVHGIVHEHKGHVLVHSRPGKGTTFRLLFPVYEGAAESAAQEEMPEPRQAGSGRIMVVDDDPVLSKYLEELLVDRGYEVTAVNDSWEALGLFEENPQAIDLVVTDQTMPKLEGDALARAMLARRPDLPVILCTGYSDRMDKEKAKALNIRGYFTKPVDAGKLTKMMSSLLHLDSKNAVM